MPYIAVNDTELHYFDEGRGTPILCIHPPVIGAICFAFQVQALRGKYRMTGFDVRGQGKSKPSRKPITYPLIVQDAISLMNALEIQKAVVCGYSTGATVALEAMLSHPDRFAAGILISGMSEVSDLMVTNEIRLGVRLARMNVMPVLAYGLAYGNTSDPQLCRAMYQTGRRGDAENSAQYFAESLNYRCTSRLQEIKSPILLASGAGDQKFQRYGQILKGNLPNHEYVTVPQCGHQLPGRAPVPLNQATDRFMQLHGNSG